VPPVDEAILLQFEFDRDAITDVRHDVAGCASQAGLDGVRLDGFVLSVNEIMTNAVRHGGGHGRVRLWRTPTGLRCEIHDDGAGKPARFNGHTLPPTEATGGRGLWLARHLCDSFDVETGRDGTRVELTMAI
jgi:anti-sigma regulatory factor (Ser/Thr protein kinase)